ncbi:PLP-dependent transferase [Rhodothermus profundi]|uniref:PLP-dependent transferase n=1 Tax=Rhodothermus profundi TaxID=633813 RepID=UPI001FEB4530|nr:PLP-dependent transferase [Rhodothermus profundi]
MARAGCHPDPTGGAVPPLLHLRPTFERAFDGSSLQGYVYSRHDNLPRNQLEDTLACLEGGQARAALISERAAATALLQALEPESHVLIPDNIHYGVRNLLENRITNREIRHSTVSFTDLEAVRTALDDQSGRKHLPICYERLLI